MRGVCARELCTVVTEAADGFTSVAAASEAASIIATAASVGARGEASGVTERSRLLSFRGEEAAARRGDPGLAGLSVSSPAPLPPAIGTFLCLGGCVTSQSSIIDRTPGTCPHNAGMRPSLFRMSVLAPHFRRRLMAARWLLCAARCSAVLPSWFTACSEAPALRSRSSTSGRPLYAERCSAVHPCLLATSRAAPRERRRSSTSRCPLVHAQ
mmetsp:Transcript_39190/g.70196  ORF Transcript_39190/g.70196 Transcript_39190/m.70196 type:complete len:212 (-) Transcript_39190:664-1299(-)